jgi:hypothetical protein
VSSCAVIFIFSGSIVKADITAPFRIQIEQLQRKPLSTFGPVKEYVTAPQWQLPLYDSIF